MHSALTRHVVRQLRRADVPQERIQELTGVSVRTIRRIEREDSGEPGKAVTTRPGRPSKTAPYRLFAESELQSEPDLHTVELLRRARLEGYAGGKTAFFDMVKDIRRPGGQFYTRFEGLPGEFTQHDFGTVVVRFVDGSTRRVKFFASRLKWSRFAAVTLVPDETAETLVRTVLEHFVVLGGMPTLAVFDRPKTVAISWEKDGTITDWNATFARAAMDIGFTAHVCWPYSPNQKGSVERIVGWVKSSFFKQRRFIDQDDLVAQLEEWLTEVNTTRPSRATGVIPSVRREQELPRLRPPRSTPDCLAVRKPITVGPTAYVTHEGHPYAVDPRLVGQDGTLFVHRDRIRLVVGDQEVAYPRRPPELLRSTAPEVRRAQLAAVATGGARYARRQHLLDLGPIAETFLTELCHAESDWVASIELLHDLLQRCGEDPVRRGLSAAADVGVFRADYVANLLGHPMEVAAK